MHILDKIIEFIIESWKDKNTILISPKKQGNTPVCKIKRTEFNNTAKDTLHLQKFNSGIIHRQDQSPDQTQSTKT